jgi:flagellar biosynthesis GTPase FlhF
MKATYVRRAAKDTFLAIRSNYGRSRVVSLIRKVMDRNMANGLGSWVGSAGPGALGMGIPGPALFWWGSPAGWTDLDLYDYNNNLMLDDNEIADIVADNIHLDPFIPLSDERNITIEVRDGVVTLSGAVRNPRVKPLAYADAFWSPGVVDVIDNIQVQPIQRRTDDRRQVQQQAAPQQVQQQPAPRQGQQQAASRQGQQQPASQQGQQQAASQQGQQQAASQQEAQQAASQYEQQPARRTGGR